MMDRINSQEIATKIETLRQNVAKMETYKHDFVNSIISQYEHFKGVTPKQLFWIERMITDPVKAPDENVGKMDGLRKLFDNAEQHLEYVGVTINVKDMGEVLLAAPETKDEARTEIWLRRRPKTPYKYYGEVNKFGVFVQYNKYVKATTEFFEILKQFAVDPIKAAVKYGHLTGSCCFCNSGLSDERSLKVGYGPICAKHYGLPWGCTAV